MVNWVDVVTQQLSEDYVNGMGRVEQEENSVFRRDLYQINQRCPPYWKNSEEARQQEKMACQVSWLFINK